jgi:hypothetical protein
MGIPTHTYPEVVVVVVTVASVVLIVVEVVVVVVVDTESHLGNIQHTQFHVTMDCNAPLVFQQMAIPPLPFRQQTLHTNKVS